MLHKEINVKKQKKAKAPEFLFVAEPELTKDKDRLILAYEDGVKAAGYHVKYGSRKARVYLYELIGFEDYAIDVYCQTVGPSERILKS